MQLFHPWAGGVSNFRCVFSVVPNTTDASAGHPRENMRLSESSTRKMKAFNLAVTSSGTQFPGSGTYTGPNPIMSRATKIVSFSIPGKKVVRNGILKYENQTTQTKFFD